MTAFQKKCMAALSGTQTAEGMTPVEFSPVAGKNENYWLAKVTCRDQTIEIYVYADEAGYMKNGKEWIVFERPDFSTEDELINRFVVSTMEVLAK